jgi:hypothetical protein
MLAGRNLGASKTQIRTPPKKTPGAESHSTLRVSLAYSVRFLGELCSKRNSKITGSAVSTAGPIAKAKA